MSKADEINQHLQNGGVVQVCTYTRATLYTSRNAGDFKTINDRLHVRRGRRFDCLEGSTGLLVKIRFGSIKP